MKSILYAFFVLFLPLLSYSQDGSGSKSEKAAIRVNLDNVIRCNIRTLIQLKYMRIVHWPMQR
ncbi:MAG: hypothetical protein HRT57_08240 [Crocinitomicaceae bacterium]|nr:hypothetical protein [Crocinitomicaceae bacterium]